MNADSLPAIFLPPVDRSMKLLDKSFFRKTVPLAAAAIRDPRDIDPLRTVLRKANDLLTLSTVKTVRNDPDDPKVKCLLLRPEVKVEDKSTWSSALTGLVEDGKVQLKPYGLELTYDDWTMFNILEAILPELPEEEKETPAGFALVGHVAHVNLKQQYLPYKNIIGRVLMDKNPKVETVINKILDVGSESVFRTFPYEVLAGPDNLDVTVSEAGCEFQFNFGKVYWNPRLSTEHARIFTKFQPGETVCDVMAGVGPFAIPAGKNNVFVHANDLNPAGFTGLQWAIKRNKVHDFVSASCEDGREFIRSSARRVAQQPRIAIVQPKGQLSRSATAQQKQEFEDKMYRHRKTYREPASFDHYVMNLPASAIEFLDAFRGLYRGRETEFVPTTDRRLPMIHVYCFQTRYDMDEQERAEICQRLSEYLGCGVEINLTNAAKDYELELEDVRLVAPKKKMYCASFRLPTVVAFANTDKSADSGMIDNDTKRKESMQP